MAALATPHAAAGHMLIQAVHMVSPSTACSCQPLTVLHQ